MEKTSIASKIGIEETSYYELLNNVSNNEVAAMIGVNQKSLQDFLHGAADEYMAVRLGLLKDELQNILNKIGNQGAIGITIALLTENAQR